MFRYILTSLLVVLVLANPVFCQMVGCGGPGGPVPSSENQRCSDSCSIKRDACCRQDACCRDSEPNHGPLQTPQTPAKPCDCPVDSHCQCFAAGAIVKEAAQFADFQQRFFAGWITVALTLAGPPVCPIWDRFEGRPLHGGANPGRIARCLHMSLLC